MEMDRSRAISGILLTLPYVSCGFLFEIGSEFTKMFCVRKSVSALFLNYTFWDTILFFPQRWHKLWSQRGKGFRTAHIRLANLVLFQQGYWLSEARWLWMSVPWEGCELPTKFPVNCRNHFRCISSVMKARQGESGKDVDRGTPGAKGAPRFTFAHFANVRFVYTV